MSPSELQPRSLYALGRLLRVVVVLEPRARTRTRSGPPRRRVARCRRRRRCGARRAAACRPSPGGRALLAVDRAEPVALAARVVLVDDRAPPLDHLRASPRPGTAPRRGPPSAGSSGRSGARSSSGSLSMRTKWVGTNCAWVTRWRSISSRHCERVEPLHQHDRAAEALRGRRPAERGGVVERGGAEVHGVGREAVHQLDQARRARRRRCRTAAGGMPGLMPFGRPVVPDE